MGSSEQSFNYRGLKLIEQVMKVTEHVVKGLIKSNEIDKMKCDFTSVRGTKDAVFIGCHLQEKHMIAKKPLYMASVDLEEAFDQVPRDEDHGGTTGKVVNMDITNGEEGLCVIMG